MEFSRNQTVKILAILLLLSAISQPIYTALALLAPEANRLILWGIEGVLFTILAAFAGSALVMSKRYSLGFSAIAFSAVLNVVQVGVGLTQFAPFRETAVANPELGALTGSVIAFSFFGYNAAKILLGLAAMVFGMAIMKTSGNGLGKALGGITLLVGIGALIANIMVLMFGISGFFPRPIAGFSGVAATLLLAICMFGVNTDGEPNEA